MANQSTTCESCPNEIRVGGGDHLRARQRLCELCQENNLEMVNSEIQNAASQCGFCGCRPGDEARWEAAADMAEFAFQERYMMLIVERLKGLAKALELDMYDARRHGWSVEEDILRSIHDDKEGGQ